MPGAKNSELLDRHDAKTVPPNPAPTGNGVGLLWTCFSFMKNQHYWVTVDFSQALSGRMTKSSCISQNY